MVRASATASRGVVVRVELARETLQPGDVLNGAVHLTLPDALPAATLKVRVLGRQGLNWLTARGGHGMVAHGNKVDHLTEEIVLVEDAALAAGASSHPFSFQLPDDLQHNFVYASRAVEELQGVRVSVQYEVEAVLAQTQVKASTVEARAPFRIDPLPLAVPFGKRAEADTQETIKFMGMIERGSCGVALSIDTDVLDSSSTIEARVTLDLKTPLTPKYVRLGLYEKAAVDRHNPLFPGKRFGSRQVCCRRVDKAAIQLAQQQGAAGAVDAIDAAVLTLHLPLSPNDISACDPLNPTMSSFFVEIGYRVVLEVKFPMAPRIQIGVPVTVIQKLVAPHELEVAPVA